jgi:hypothetical protein
MPDPDIGLTGFAGACYKGHEEKANRVAEAVSAGPGAEHGSDAVAPPAGLGCSHG